MLLRQQAAEGSPEKKMLPPRRLGTVCRTSRARRPNPLSDALGSRRHRRTSPNHHTLPGFMELDSYLKEDPPSNMSKGQIRRIQTQ